MSSTRNNRDIVTACDEIRKILQERVRVDPPASHGNEPSSSAELQVTLAKTQKELYQPLLTLRDNGKPIIGVLGAHFFSQDGIRLTQLLSNTTPVPHGNKRRPPAVRPPSFDSFLMLAYRQIFEERHTLNAWLLRAKETQGTMISLALQGAHPRGSIAIPQQVANALVDDKLVKAVISVVESVTTELGHQPHDVEVRTHHASTLFAKIRELLDSPLGRLAQLPEPITTQLEAIQREFGRRYYVPGAPTDELESLLRMLRSSIFYMKAYKCSYFYTLLSAQDDDSYGLTILARSPLPHIDAIQKVVNEIAAAQDKAVQGAVERSESRTRTESAVRFLFCDDFSGEPKNDYERAAHALTRSVLNKARIAPHGFYALIRTLEHAARFQQERQYRRAAFVLARRSDLESTGIVNVEDVPVSLGSAGYAKLFTGRERNEWESLESSFKPDDLLQTDTFRDLIPHDVVTNAVHGSEPPTMNAFLEDRFRFPNPEEGFHLLDLDLSLRSGEKRPYRLRLGAIGWFMDGRQLTGRGGLDAYVALSRKLEGLVIGMIPGNGEARLIFQGRVHARFRHGIWEFYDRDVARAAFLGAIERAHLQDFLGDLHDHNPRLEQLLESIERISHSYQRGAMLVVTPYGSLREWQASRHRYFVEMTDQEHSLPFSATRPFEDASHTALFLNLAQVDGSCVLLKNGELAGYGLKVAVGLDRAFSGETESATRKAREVSIRKNVGSPGTRRWASALLSLAPVEGDGHSRRKHVVVNVSSDGPVTVFHDGHATLLYPQRPQSGYPHKPEMQKA